MIENIEKIKEIFTFKEFIKKIEVNYMDDVTNFLLYNKKYESTKLKFYFISNSDTENLYSQITKELLQLQIPINNVDKVICYLHIKDNNTNDIIDIDFVLKIDNKYYLIKIDGNKDYWN